MDERAPASTLTAVPRHWRFGAFVLSVAQRRLTRDDTPIALPPRYFDALMLLVASDGAVVSKERFFAEVWRGVPVGDEALTQCVRSLRRALGDDAAAPRYIATVPKHGYRFVAPVTAETAARTPPALAGWGAIVGAGTAGGAVAGVVGGLAYGVLAASGSAGGAALSVVAVVAALCLAVAALGSAAVVLGIALAARAGWPRWTRVAAGAGGGLAMGAAFTLVGLDALALLAGLAPGHVTGPLEGAAVGAVVALADLAAARARRWRGAVWRAAAVGGMGGGAIALAGGRLMAGSLDQLVRGSPAARLRLDALSQLLGETQFGLVSSVATAAAEGALFAGGVVGALWLARRKRG